VKTTYHFNTFLGANSIAKHAIELGAENVSLRPRSKGFSVSFASSSWNVESRIFSLDVPCSKGYRTGNKWSQDEIDFVVDAYMCWHSIDEIADKVRRNPNGVVVVLHRLGYVERAKSLEDAWDQDWVELDSDWHFSYSKYQVDKHELSFVLAYWGVFSCGSAYGPFHNLNQKEIDKAFNHLMWFEKWDCAACFAIELGDLQRAFRLARQGNNMRLALDVLNATHELSPIYAFQRDMLSAFLRTDILDEFSSKIEHWVKAAKFRQQSFAFYEDEYTYFSKIVRPILPINFYLDGIKEPISDDFLALTGSVEELDMLVKRENKLAACFLADILRDRMWVNLRTELDADMLAELFPDGFLYGDAAAKKIQDGYWPTKNEIETLIQQHLLGDKNMALKLSHRLVTETPHRLPSHYSYYKYHLLDSHEDNYPQWLIKSAEYDEVGAEGFCFEHNSQNVQNSVHNYDNDWDYEHGEQLKYESEVSSEILSEMFGDACASARIGEDGWYE
jgi:hypothetical protein